MRCACYRLIGRQIRRSSTWPAPRRDDVSELARELTDASQQLFGGFDELRKAAQELARQQMQLQMAQAEIEPGVDVAHYASVANAMRLSFAPDGTLFAGRDVSATGSTDALKIHRIGAGGAPGELIHCRGHR